MPDIVGLYRRWRPYIIRQPVVVVRLHGPDREGMEEITGKRWDRLVAPKDEELSGITDMVMDMLDQGVDVYVNVNNHYEGSAPQTIDRIRELLRARDSSRD
jgi:uncharacterized protein YecE (DUF72 family)